MEAASGPYRELAREIEGTVVTPSTSSYRRDKVLVEQPLRRRAPTGDRVLRIGRGRREDDALGAKARNPDRPSLRRPFIRRLLDDERGRRRRRVADAPRPRAQRHRHGRRRSSPDRRLRTAGGARPHDPAGSCPTVGIAGLAQGGGVGYAGRKLGLTCDNVVRVSLVTARRKPARVQPRTSTRTSSGPAAAAAAGTSGSPRASASEPTGSETSRTTRSSGPGPTPPAPSAPGSPSHRMLPMPSSRPSTCRRTRPRGPGTEPFVSSGGQFFGSEAELRSLIAPLVAAGNADAA